MKQGARLGTKLELQIQMAQVSGEKSETGESAD